MDPRALQPLRHLQGTSGKFRVLIDGRPSPFAADGVYDLSAKQFGGNFHFAGVVTTGLDANTDHTVELTPILEAGQAIRLESICVAGAPARVYR